MHLVGAEGKSTGVDPRIRRTEQAVVPAARELFERQGYAATTMAQIAERAGYAERTLFLRFGSKAELLKRVVDDTFLGSENRAELDARRTRMRTAATLEGRLRAFAEGAADALVRTGPLFAVAREAEITEPLIADAFAAARHDARSQGRRFWKGLADDGLLHPEVDLDWVVDTLGLLASPDTYLLIQATLGWSRDQLAAWLFRTWTHFATTPS